MQKIVVLTGAGVSAESGLSTFRDAGGLWEGYDVMEVASPEGWHMNRELVLRFYNERRNQLKTAQPNDAHKAIASLEEKFDVTVITQNVDDLHERAGSTKVVHLHGELTKARSSLDSTLVYDIGYGEIKAGDKCERGSQLRPHVVWFGEMVPMIEVAAHISEDADIFIVVGTSLVVYPAASLIEFTRPSIIKYIIDPVKPDMYYFDDNLIFIEEKAGLGMPELARKLLSN
ncbi:MAG: NAD-dependent deacylase [Ignavibacteriae bacterium]|nr:NAD-dependent deacylase [Ignavibacteriota bacterium]MCB9242205.1 NAD-dependent deacylase [Ignavibacteriales bacterium]